MADGKPVDAEGPIDISGLPIPQLQFMKQQFERETGTLTAHFQQLKAAQAAFAESKSALGDITPAIAEKTVLVPLTNSLYVPGRITNTQKVLVDVGTGYYVEKSVKDAAAFMDKKIDYLQNNTSQLQNVISQKRNDLSTVTQLLQHKVQQQAAATAPGAAAQ